MLSNIDFGSYFHTKKYEKGLSTGGDKIADWGGSKGGWGGHVPPVFMLKEALSLGLLTKICVGSDQHDQSM